MGVHIEFKILMRKVKSPLKQTTPLQICSAPFLNSPEKSRINISTAKIYFLKDICSEIIFMKYKGEFQVITTVNEFFFSLLQTLLINIRQITMKLEAT